MLFNTVVDSCFKIYNFVIIGVDHCSRSAFLIIKLYIKMFDARLDLIDEVKSVL